MYIDSPNISGSLTITGSLILNGTAVTASGGGGGSGAGFPFSGSAVITGSLYVSGGNLSGSFVGDGAGLTGVLHAVSASYAVSASHEITYEKSSSYADFALSASYASNVTIDQFATYEDTFTNVPSHSAVHNFGTKNVFVQVFESDDTLLIPYSVTTTTANQVDIVFGDTLSGRVVIGKAGHILQDIGNFVSSSTAVQTFTNATTASINHYLDSFNVITQVFDSNNNVIVPSNIKVATKDRVDLTFASSRSGKVVIAKAGHIVSGTAAVSASYAETSSIAQRVRAGSSGSRPTDYANISTGSLWYNTNTLALEAFTGVSGSWWQSIGSASLSAPTVNSFVATGGTITTSGGYTYHTFTSSDSFIVTSGTKNIDYLVIAGGGGAGDGDNAVNTGGGGGAGGIVLTSGTSISSGTHTVTVGAGGNINTNGDDSSFNSTTTTGGGSGGTPTGNDSGGSGGSGGGAGPGGSAGSSTAGQGNDGGDSDSRCGGGGGGAGAVGGNVTVAGDGAPGGDGVNTYSEWATATSTGASGYYGGGGGSGDPTGTNLSGPGGAGGGGNGGYQGGTTEQRNGQAGTENTGGGGGSAADGAYVSAAGGSGLVIIRYLT